MDTKQARAVILAEIERLGLQGLTVKVQTQGFQDLTRRDAVFVKVTGPGMTPVVWNRLKETATSGGFFMVDSVLAG